MGATGGTGIVVVTVMSGPPLLLMEVAGPANGSMPPRIAVYGGDGALATVARKWCADAYAGMFMA